MIIWCEKDYLTIMSDKVPQTAVRKPLPSDSKEERKEKAKKPYINKVEIVFYVNYLGKAYHIYIPRGYTWDGATCMGLHHFPPLLNASMLHDAICETHSVIGNDRQLSSMIFREMGIASGMNKAFMYTAYHAIDNFQKVFGKDNEGNKWP